MRRPTGKKRPLEPGGDNVVCGMEVCDEDTETDAYVDEGFTDEMTGAPLLRDDVAKGRVEEMGW